MRSILSILQYGLGLSFLLMGCSAPQTSEPALRPEAVLSALDFGTTKISDVQKEKTNFTVRLQGKMGAQAPLLGQRAFELRDASGSIWVVTREKLPAIGSEVKLTGKVRYQSILLEGKESGTVYVEQQGLVEVTPASKASVAS